MTEVKIKFFKQTGKFSHEETITTWYPPDQEGHIIEEINKTFSKSLSYVFEASLDNQYSCRLVING